MEITAISPVNELEWLDIREQCNDFISRFGSRRHTQGELKQLQKMPFNELHQPGTSLIAATVRGEYGQVPVGVCFVSGFGQKSFLIAIHPLYRNRNLGPSLILSQKSTLGYLYCKVGVDHYSSLHICFDAGMHAIALERSSTGKPTLIMSTCPMESPASNSMQEGDLLCLNQF